MPACSLPSTEQLKPGIRSHSVPEPDSTSPPGPEGSHSDPNTHSAPSGPQPLSEHLPGMGKSQTVRTAGSTNDSALSPPPEARSMAGSCSAGTAEVAASAHGRHRPLPAAAAGLHPPPRRRPGAFRRGLASEAGGGGGDSGSPGWFSGRTRTPPQTRGGRCWVQPPRHQQSKPASPGDLAVPCGTVFSTQAAVPAPPH